MQVSMGYCLYSIWWKSTTRSYDTRLFKSPLKYKSSSSTLRLRPLASQVFLYFFSLQVCDLNFLGSLSSSPIFGSTRNENGEWRRLHNEELHSLYRSPNIVRVIKSRRLRWAGHVARMEEGRFLSKF